MERNQISFSLILLSIFLLPSSDCSKILIMSPIPAPSHWLMFQDIIQELLTRGHQLTVITSYKYKSLSNANYTEILIDPKYDYDKLFTQKDIFNLKYENNLNMLKLFWEIGIETSKYGLEHRSVQKFINRNDLEFDLVISNQFYQESFLMFAHKYNAPIITVGTFGYSDFMDRAMGFLTPWSFIPHFILNYNDDMNFMQRFYNVYISSIDMFFRRFYYMPAQEAIAKKYFGNLPHIKKPLPSVAELEKSISVMLINDHRSMSPPRPLMPGLIDIGGMHIKPVKPLPADIQKFIDEAKHGTIYFCLGSLLQAKNILPEKVEVFLQAFRKLKQRVLWKFEGDIPNLPDNVMIRKWMPQSDILAHKNIILFITHGGLYGTMEGTSRGVPMLFIPFFGDQPRNALKAVDRRYGLMQPYNEITAESFYKMIIDIINNPKYSKKAKQMSALFNDNIVSPKETAMYWIEYVIKHRGAPHLKSKSVNLPLYKQLLLDILFVYLILFYVAFYLLRSITKRVFCNNNNNNNNTADNVKINNKNKTKMN